MWSEERVNAYKRYIEEDEKAIKRWELTLQKHLEGVEDAKMMIESYKGSKARSIRELAEQGITV